MVDFKVRNAKDIYEYWSNFNMFSYVCIGPGRRRKNSLALREVTKTSVLSSARDGEETPREERETTGQKHIQN